MKSPFNPIIFEEVDITGTNIGKGWWKARYPGTRHRVHSGLRRGTYGGEACARRKVDGPRTTGKPGEPMKEIYGKHRQVLACRAAPRAGAVDVPRRGQGDAAGSRISASHHRPPDQSGRRPQAQATLPHQPARQRWARTSRPTSCPPPRPARQPFVVARYASAATWSECWLVGFRRRSYSAILGRPIPACTCWRDRSLRLSAHSRTSV